ncbi:MAG: hypothetical protein A2144_11150 [Chloroflexi bacterium RBG_16_50_9]|nr:MAG: hypothetical protein A2144_11150 [Chloroflexi bacterium RBG_16_50_9]
MGRKIAKILDECLGRISQGESEETCLASFAGIRHQLEPLLHTALSISSLPRISPTDEFRKTSQARLMARLSLEATDRKAVALEQGVPLLDDLATAGQRLWQILIGVKKVAIPVTLALFLTIAISIGAFNFGSPPTVLASECTLSILSGDVAIQTPNAGAMQRGDDGMTLSVGTRIKTEPGSHALITFFDGSTIKLQPGTEIEIQKLESNSQETTTIVLKQWMGKTWSRVVKMADPGSRYEIETPSAYAIVRGTLFATEVDATGETTVATTEGLVSVIAQGEEVYLPPDQQTMVASGANPSAPFPSQRPSAEIVLNIGAPAVASVIDPTGASTGYLPEGLSFNQIPGSQSSLSAGSQVITIPHPDSGEYIIALRFVNDGTSNFEIKGTSDGQNAFSYTGNYGGSGESGWLIRLNLKVNNGLIVDSKINGIKPLSDEKPEKLVIAAAKTTGGNVSSKPSSNKEHGQPAPGGANGQNNDNQGNSNSQNNDNQGQGNSNSQNNDNQGQGNSNSQNNDNQRNGNGQDNDNQGNSNGQNNNNQGNGNSQNNDNQGNSQNNDNQRNGNGQDNDNQGNSNGQNNNNQGNGNGQDNDNQGNSNGQNNNNQGNGNSQNNDNQDNSNRKK